MEEDRKAPAPTSPARRVGRFFKRSSAADVARQRAIVPYLAYRRDGGENPLSYGRIFDLVVQATENNQVPADELQLAQLAGKADLPASLKGLLLKLQAILHGARDVSIGADPALEFNDAAEIQLLLRHLARDQKA